MEIDGYLMIDDTVKVNTKNYPKVVQNTIDLLEKFDGEGDWVMYDGISSGFMHSSSHYMQKVLYLARIQSTS